MRLLPPSQNTTVRWISKPTCSSAGGEKKKTTGSTVSLHEITSECNKQVQPVRILRSFFFCSFIQMKEELFFFFDWGLLSPLASGGKSRMLMASDTPHTWRNAQEGSIPHAPLHGGGSERARQHPDAHGARLPLSLTRHGCGFEYDGFSFSLMGN